MPEFFSEELGLLGDPSGVAFVILASDGVLDVAEHHESRHLHERIDQGGGRVGDQEHVALVYRGPTADAGAINAEPLVERLESQLADGIGDVMLEAGDIGEADVYDFDFIPLGELKYLLWMHTLSSD